jgi:CHAT domain-containing protein
VFALSRGFLAAGAQRVVATQWQVDDRATAVLIGHFFEVIAEAERAGEVVDYARALRDAKLRVRNDADNPRWSDPFYWAAFTITGQR